MTRLGSPLTSVVALSAVGLALGNNVTITKDEYYAKIDKNAVDNDLKGQLKALIFPHTVLSYDDVWAAFATVDKNLPGYPCDNDLTKIPDVYSKYCWKTGVKVTPGGECGNYKKEGDCFNREHLWPKSWYGGFDAGKGAQTDLFELWPSDGYVNGLRGNLPFCDVSVPTYTSTNGCLIGSCDAKEFNGKGFEPVSYLKGDFARSYFYLSTAYWKEWSCCDDVGVNKSDIKPWMEKILREWHANDPVDDLERARNEVIFTDYQHNRNPFIDFPEFVDQISDF